MANTKETETSDKLTEANAPAGEPVFSLEDFESGKIAVDPGWLIESWGSVPEASQSKSCLRR